MFANMLRGAKQTYGCELFSINKYAQQYGVDKTLLDSLKGNCNYASGTYKQRSEITSEVADSINPFF
jgi:hypothetical protein